MFFEIEDTVLGVGRDDTEDIQIYDQGVSRKHAEIFRVGEMYFIRDLGSKNGTYVNGERISEELLRAGDTIRIGAAILEFEESSSIEEGVPQPKKLQVEVSENPANNLASTGIYRLDTPTIEDTFDPEGASHESKDLQVIYDVVRTLKESSEPNVLMQKILKFAVDAVSGDQGYIFIKDFEKKELVLEASFEKEGKTKPSISRGIIKRVIKAKRALLISDAMQDKRFKENASVMMKNIRSVLCAPLVALDQLNGVIYITKASLAEQFSEEDLDLVTTIGIQTGMALQSIYSTQELHKLFLNTVKTLVSAIEMRMPSSKGYSSQVANYATAISFTLGLKKEEIKRIQLSALLHNLGRIALSDADITQKPEKKEEYVEYKQALMAEKLLLENTGMVDLLPGIKYHNERWDGAGYPEGLEGEGIPLDGRIIAVAKGFADLYDGSEKRESIKEALMNLQKEGGSHFDKSIIQALIIAYRSGHLFTAASKMKF